MRCSQPDAPYSQRRRAVRPVADLAADHTGPPRSELLRPVTVSTDREGARRRPIVALWIVERAELVALDIGKRDPVRIFAEDPGAQIQQRSYVADVDIEVHPVLHGFWPSLRPEGHQRSPRG